jgi:uncharacterized protein (DUF4415 family)
VRKQGNIVRYSAEEIDAMIARGEDRTDWARIDAKTEEELAADTASDPAWDGVPEDWVSRAHRATGLMRGRHENKRQVTMRFDADILDYFKSQGRGWQSRMNAVLRGFVEREHQTVPKTAPVRDDASRRGSR